MIISIAETREILREKGNKYTDAQLEEIVNILTVVADLAIDSFIEKKKRKTDS